MDIKEQRRKLFESCFGYGAKLPRDPLNVERYESELTQSAWWGFNKALDCVVIELPLINNADTPYDQDECEILRDGISMSKAAIESTGLGIKIK